MQHTEYYECYIWHAAATVVQAQRLRWYAGGGAAGGGKVTGLFGTDRENIATAILGLGGKAAADPVNLAV